MMIGRRLTTTILALAGLAGGAGMSSAAAYSAEQLALAEKIGTAVAQSRICNGTVPTSAVVRALAGSGLTEKDVLDDTAIRRRMQRQASAVLAASDQQIKGGEPRTAVVRSACAGFRASFGPNGFLVPDNSGGRPGSR
jgi:hypothetical protein